MMTEAEVRERFEDAMVLALKMEEGTTKLRNPSGL